MKHIKSYYVYKALIESASIEESEEELKDFQKENDIQKTKTDILKTIQSVELNWLSIFKQEYSNVIDNILSNPDFLEELKTKNMKISELFNSKDSTNLVDKPFKYFWIYSKESDQFSTPIYLVMQSYGDGKIYKKKIYYPQDNIDKFYSGMDQLTMSIKKGDDKYIYTSSNSGRNWKLEDPTKKTDMFGENLLTDDVEQFLQNKDLIVEFY
jgi:hypothetical protein